MEILPAISPQQSSFDVLIAQAIDKNVSVESLERLLTIREKLDAEFAKQQFNLAMSSFQVECPIIEKKKAGALTKGGIVTSRYAPLDIIDAQTKVLRHKHGFSYSINTEPDPKGVHVYITVIHLSGHERVTHVFMPFVERTGVMTEAHVEMATMTIATRRCFCNAFGIMTGEQDQDGFMDKEEQLKSTQNQIDRIDQFLSDESMKTQITKGVLLKKYNITNLTELTRKDASSIINSFYKLKERLDKEESTQSYS